MADTALGPSGQMVVCENGALSPGEMLSPTSRRRSRSVSRPSPCSIRYSTFWIQPVPSRQGVHLPQLSWAKNLASRSATRLIETEPGLDADHEEVERVGQRQADAVLAALGRPRQQEPRHDIADGRGGECDQHVRPEQNRRAERHEADHGKGDTKPGKDDDRFLAAVAGPDQTLPQPADLALRRRHRSSEALHRLHDGITALFGRFDAAEHHARSANLAKPLFDDRASGRRHHHGGGADEQRNEQKGEERQKNRHTTPRS